MNELIAQLRDAATALEGLAYGQLSQDKRSRTPIGIAKAIVELTAAVKECGSSICQSLGAVATAINEVSSQVRRKD